MSTQTCPTVLITDEPSKIDLFGAEGRPGGHERIAKAIAEQIQEHRAPMTIALEGGWGAGKSTVVELLKKHLAPIEDYCVAIVDTWAHQGDPLRRTFLQSIVKTLIQHGWVDEQKWQRKLRDLSERRHVSTKEPIVSIGLLGQLLAIGLFAVPLGLVFLQIGFSMGVSFDFSRGYPLNWPFTIGLGLSAGPLVLALYCLRRPAVLSVLLLKQEPTSTTITLENPDPTSVEFQHYFQELLADAITGKRRIVLVLDNLDRLDAADALQILSTLQAFVYNGPPEASDPSSGLVVMIPYDPEGMRRLFGELGNTGEGVIDVVEPPRKRSLALSMLDKRFQVRYTMGPLVLSNWRQYLIGLLRLALPNHTDEDYENVYELFRSARLSEPSSPTPRDLKLFVNQLGAIHRLWQHSFPLVQEAYFAFLVRQGVSVPSGLSDGSVPNEAIVPLLGDSPQDNLAAMSFNVPVALARQLRLGDPILRALQKGDAAALANLIEASEGGFDVLATVDFASLAKTNTPFQLADAATALSEPRLSTTANNVQWKTTIRKLQLAFQQVKVWKKPTPKTAKGVASAILLTRDIGLASHVLDAMSKAPIDEGDSKVEAPDVKAFVDAATTILSACISVGFDLTTLAIRVPFPASHYLDAMRHLAENDAEGRFWACFSPSSDAEEVIASISAAITAGAIRDVGLGAIQVLKAQHVEWDWEGLVSSTQARLGQSAALPAGEMEVLLAILWSLTDTLPGVADAFGTLVSNGTLHHHFYNAFSQKDWGACGLITYTILKHSPSGKPASDFGNSAAGTAALVDLVQNDNNDPIRASFASIIKERHDSQVLFEADNAVSYDVPFINSSVSELAGTSEAKALFGDPFLSKGWGLLSRSLDVKMLDELVVKVVADTGLSLVTRQPFDPSLAGLYATIVHTTKTLDTSFTSWCLTALHQLDEAAWATALEEEEDLVSLVVALIEKGVDVGLGTSFLDAFVNHTMSVVQGERKVQYYAEDWSKLPRALEGDHRRKKLSRDLVDKLVATGASAPPEVFALYRDSLTDIDVISGHTGVVRSVFTPFLEARHERGLEWIAILAARHPEVLRNYKPIDTLQVFQDRLVEAMGREEDVSTLHIKNIATALGIRPSTESPDHLKNDEQG